VSDFKNPREERGTGGGIEQKPDKYGLRKIDKK